MTLIDLIRQSWGWTGLEPVEIIAANEFGNLLVRDARGHAWRLCPEDLYCDEVADSPEGLSRLLQDPGFIEDWEMRSLVAVARSRLGPLGEGRRYCLRIPGPLGGEYAGENLATLPIGELIGFSGDVARQVASMPDGTPITFAFPG